MRAGGVRCERATSLSAAPRQRRAREQQTNVQRHFHPSRWTEVEREERKPHGTQHQVHPETTPSPPAPLKGGKKKRRKSRAAEFPKKFSRGAQPPAQEEQSLKGEIYFVPYRFFSWQKVPTAPETNQHKSHKSCHECIFCPYT